MPSGIRERDEQLSCEMVEAGLSVFNRYLSDRFGVNGYSFAKDFIADVYLAMRGAVRSPEQAQISRHQGRPTWSPDPKIVFDDQA
jgi:hypothetical protein